MEFNERQKELRKKKKITQEELADNLNVTRQAITKWETGNGIPDIDNLKNIANYFDVSIDYLIGNSNKKVNTKTKVLLSFIVLLGIFIIFLSFCNLEYSLILCLTIFLLIVSIEYFIKYGKNENYLLENDVNLDKKFIWPLLNINNLKERIKNYLYSSLFLISSIEIIITLGKIFKIIKNNYSIFEINITKVLSINNLLNFIFDFIILYIIFFIVIYICNEISVTKFKRKRK